MNKYKEYQKFGISLPKLQQLSSVILFKNLPFYCEAFDIELKP